MNPVPQKFTAIWQSKTPHERDYIEEIFGPFIETHVYDGAHDMVLDNAILFDAFIARYPLAYYEKFRGKNAFLVHFLDENYDGGYERYTPFRGVFRKHWSGIFETPGIRKLPLGYSNGFKRTAPPPPASGRPFVWSFAGAATKSTRPAAIRALGQLTPHVVYASDNFAAPNIKIHYARLPEADSFALLTNSIFAPAPMGNTNLECYRLYEALEAGAIPLIEKRPSFDYHKMLFGPHPIPSFVNWRDAAQFIMEIKNSAEKIDELQKTCMSWWDSYKTNLTAQIGNFLVAPVTSGPCLAHPHSALWQYGELLRHQNFTSLAWRVKRNAARLLTAGRFRDR